MALHVFTHSQVVPAPLEECWRFFANPRNLARLIPPELEFTTASDAPTEIRPGLLLAHRVRLQFGFAVNWLTEITHVSPPDYFIDEQRLGPFRLWHHEHHFRAIDGAHTELRDLVQYVVPCGWLGELVHPWIVVPQLRHLWDFRENTIAEIFGR